VKSIVVSLLLLAACGGHSGPTDPFEGVWIGTWYTGQTFFDPSVPGGMVHDPGFQAIPARLKFMKVGEGSYQLAGVYSSPLPCGVINLDHTARTYVDSFMPDLTSPKNLAAHPGFPCQTAGWASVTVTGHLTAQLGMNMGGGQFVEVTIKDAYPEQEH